MGMGGSGRNSLTKIATYLAYNNSIYLLDSKNLIEDIQSLLKQAGIDN